MKLNILFSYQETVIPPRCRKPREVQFSDGSLQVEIPSVASVDAPVAIECEGNFCFRQDERYAYQYRFWNGRLWTPLQIDGAEPRGRTCGQDDWDFPNWPSDGVLDLRQSSGRNGSYAYGYYQDACFATRSDVVQNIKCWAHAHVLIDGVPHRPAGEPRYEVATFGLGGNHGGTALFVVSHYNSNVPHSHYFNLRDREAALMLAAEIALRRGDTESVPIRPHGPSTIRVNMPEVLMVDPAAQHGDGDPFLNQLSAITEAAAGNTALAAVGVLSAAVA